MVLNGLTILANLMNNFIIFQITLTSVVYLLVIVSIVPSAAIVSIDETQNPSDANYVARGKNVEKMNFFYPSFSLKYSKFVTI